MQETVETELRKWISCNMPNVVPPSCANINFLLKQPLARESKFAQSRNINYTVLSGREGEALIFTQAIKMSPGLDWKTELLAMLKKGNNKSNPYS